MVDYEYYVNCYLGSLIPEREFTLLATRAKDYLEKLCRTVQVTGGEDARAMAVCAMAEELYRSGNRRGVTSASIGGVSVHYQESTQVQLQRALYRQASIYLDIYRGRCGDESD